MTANQLRQALRTHTTLWLSWMTVLLWLLIHVLLWGPRLWSSEPLSELLLDIMWTTLTASVALGTMMGWMLKLQFANPRARLLPGFRAAHLVVAGAIVGAAIAIQAVLVPPGGGAVEPLALLSLSLLAIVAAAWIAYLMSLVGFCLFIIITLLFARIFAPQHITGLIQALNDSPIVCLGIACVGLAAMAALGVRLWTLSEEKPKYSRQVPVFWDFTSRAGNRNRRRWEALAIARSGTHVWLRDVQFRLVLRRNMAMGPLRRLLLRQLAGGFAGLPLMTITFVSMLSLLLRQSWLQKPVDADGVFFLAFFPQYVVFCMLGAVWLRRRSFLAPESLRPLGRRDFVRDLARSMACDIAGPAAVHCAMIFIWLKLVWPQVAPPGLLLPWLALTVAQYVVAYCLLFWLVSLRRPLVQFLGISVANAISAALVMAALFFAAEGFWSPVNVAAAIIATALAMALLYQLAFRRWCRLDLG